MLLLLFGVFYNYFTNTRGQVEKVSNNQVIANNKDASVKDLKKNFKKFKNPRRCWNLRTYCLDG